MVPHIPRSAACIAALGFLLSAASSQEPRIQHVPPPQPRRDDPAPRNLKVLPRNLTVGQVNKIMREWSGQLGVQCEACHVRQSEAVISAGPAYERFADDSKPMKSVARIMFSMTADINRKYITGDDGVGGPVTCGTCHRGSIRSQPFLPPPAQTSSQETVTSR